METEENCQLNFLDINIKKHNNHLKFSIYRKPTTTDTVIHYNSQQSWQIKLSPFHSLIHRLTNFPLDEDDFNKKLNIIKQIAKNNGYNESLIENMVQNKQRKMLQKEFFTPTNKTSTYNFINYIPKYSEKISRKLNNLGISTISVNKTNLGSILVNNKEKINKLNKSGVYEIKCKDCNAVYIGQSGRSIANRVNEHKKSILNNNKNTGMATHCIENNHFIDTENINLIHRERKGKRLNLLEQLEIKKSFKSNPCTTNDQQNFINTPIIDKVLRIPH